MSGINEKIARASEPVQSANISATGSLLSTPARLRGVVLRSVATSGTAIFRNGGTAGTALVTLNTPAAVGLHEIEIPGGGVVFGTDLFVTLTNVDAATVFYVHHTNEPQ